MIGAWLLGCQPSDPPAPPPAPDPFTTSSPEPTPPSPEVPGIAEVLGDCGGAFQEPNAYPNQLRQGTDLHRLTLAAEGAVCGDGTAAALYVRAATDPAETASWILHLQGGGDCVSFEECEVRWCGTEGFYDASKMSATWAPDPVGAAGIVSASAGASAVKTWNQAYFYYCSSDLWSGQGTALLTSEDGTRQMQVERRGHTILDAGLAALEAGAIADDKSQALTSILDADRVWFTGTSAGSVGAQMHLDWAAERLPGADVRGVFDAAVRPDPTTVQPSVSANLAAVLQARFSERVAQESPSPFQPANCEQSTPEPDQWQCSASSYLPYLWVETPFFAKMDLFDSAAWDDYAAAGATREEYSSAIAASLDLLASREIDGQPTGVFGAACGQHVALEEDWWFFKAAISDGVAPVTLHDAVLDAMSGLPVKLLDPDRTLSKCQ